MWRRLKGCLKGLSKDRRGFTLLEMLILGVIVGGAALVITAALKGQLAATHNSAVNTIQNLTGGGF
ncbi:MAG: type II secretion system protein [Moorella sp. (in: firmicutes)]